jgi:hypothetical protein
VTAALLTLRFLLELALLAAFAVGGWNLSEETWLQVLLAVALPVLAAFVWGLLLSPKAKVASALPIRVAIELALFVAASALLWSAGLSIVAVVLLLTELTVVLTLIATGTPPGSDVGHLHHEAPQ